MNDLSRRSVSVEAQSAQHESRISELEDRVLAHPAMFTSSDDGGYDQRRLVSSTAVIAAASYDDAAETGMAPTAVEFRSLDRSRPTSRTALVFSSRSASPSSSPLRVTHTSPSKLYPAFGSSGGGPRPSIGPSSSQGPDLGPRFAYDRYISAATNSSPIRSQSTSVVEFAAEHEASPGLGSITEGQRRGRAVGRSPARSPVAAYIYGERAAGGSPAAFTDARGGSGESNGGGGGHNRVRYRQVSRGGGVGGNRAGGGGGGSSSGSFSLDDGRQLIDTQPISGDGSTVRTTVSVGQLLGGGRTSPVLAGGAHVLAGGAQSRGPPHVAFLIGNSGK